METIKIKTTRDHFEKYAALAKKFNISLKGCKTFLDYTPDEMRHAVQADEHLNNIPLCYWDLQASSFFVHNRNSKLSLAEAVCLYKHLAIFEFAGCEPEFETEG